MRSLRNVAFVATALLFMLHPARPALSADSCDDSGNTSAIFNHDYDNQTCTILVTGWGTDIWAAGSEVSSLLGQCQSLCETTDECPYYNATFSTISDGGTAGFGYCHLASAYCYCSW